MADSNSTDSSTPSAEIKSEPSSSCSTSEPEGEGQVSDSLSYLRHAIDRTVVKCVSSLRFSHLAKNYPAVYKRNPKFLKGLHKNYTDQLISAVNAEIDLVIEKENLKEVFQNFSDIHKKDAQHWDRQAWRPSGNPTKDVSAHLIPVKMKQKEQLQNKLDSILRENQLLEASLHQRRQKVLSASQLIAEKKQGLKNSLDQMNTTEILQYLSDIQRQKNL